MSKIQNSIWIKNTNKTGQETMNLLKLLKDLGVFKEKPKKRKRKAKEQAFEDEEILQQPSGGGGSDIGGGGGDIGGGNITSNLLALKGALSAKNTDEENIKKLKDATELQLGKLRDAQQDLTRTQQRSNFGFPKRSEFGVGSGPKQDFIEDIDESVNYFPDKEVVVAPTNYEMNREGASINIPDEVMEKDISPQVNPEEGIIEDIDEQEYINPRRPTQGTSEFELAVDYLRNSDKYNIKRFPTFQESNKTKFDIYMELLNSLGIRKPAGPPYRSSTSSVLDPALRQIIIRAYRDDMEEVD
jgi:hypothetical protein